MFAGDPHRRDVAAGVPSISPNMQQQQQAMQAMMPMQLSVGPNKSFECTEPGCNKRAQRSTSGVQSYCCQHMREKGMKPMESRRQCAHNDASGKPCLKQVQRSHDGKYTHCREHMKLYGLKPANRAVCRFPGCKKRVNREKKLCDTHSNGQFQHQMLEGGMAVNDDDGGSGHTDSDTDADKSRVTPDMMVMGSASGLARGIVMQAAMDTSSMPVTPAGINTPGKVVHPSTAGFNPYLQRCQILEAKIASLEEQVKQAKMHNEQQQKMIQQQSMMIDRQNILIANQMKQLDQQNKLLEMHHDHSHMAQPKMQVAAVTGGGVEANGGNLHDMHQQHGAAGPVNSMSMSMHHSMMQQYQDRHDPAAQGVAVHSQPVHPMHGQHAQHGQHPQHGQQLVPDQSL